MEIFSSNLMMIFDHYISNKSHSKRWDTLANKYIAGIIIMCCSVLSCTGKNDNNTKQGESSETQYSITIYDSDYSLALSLIYELNNEDIRVIFSGELEGESDSIVYERQLTFEEQLKISEYLRSFPINALDSSYIEPYVDDGDQKYFLLKIGKSERKIQTSNHYQRDLGSLVNLVNDLVPAEFKMIYEDDS